MLKTDVNKIQEWIEGMAIYNSTPEFGTTRILFTKPELENRKYVKNEFEKLGLVVEEDAIGNIFATYKGMDSSLAPIWTGSHIDTVPNAGNYDGMAGVICAMAAIKALKEADIRPKRDIKIVVYTSEEPTRYGLGCLGSRALAGYLKLEDTKNLIDMSGRSLYEKLKELHYDVDNKFQDIVKQSGEVYASLELHIEQNSKLEKAGIPIGIVTKICAPSNYNVTVTGVQSHAGGTSMEDRRDAYAAACEMGIALENIAKECKSEFNTATIGIVNVIPGAVNVIPGECSFTVDIRDCNWNTKQETIARFKQEFELIAKKRGVSVIIEEENNDIPLTCDATIKEMLEQACDERKLKYMELVSGPFHDSLFVGKFTPTAMIFVPSLNGISHSPKEWTDYEDLAKGADVLMDTLVSLSNQ